MSIIASRVKWREAQLAERSKEGKGRGRGIIIKTLRVKLPWRGHARVVTLRTKRALKLGDINKAQIIIRRNKRGPHRALCDSLSALRTWPLANASIARPKKASECPKTCSITSDSMIKFEEAKIKSELKYNSIPLIFQFSTIQGMKIWHKKQQPQSFPYVFQLYIEMHRDKYMVLPLH